MMRHAVRGLSIIICLASLSAAAASNQTTSTKVVPTITPAPVAYVYVSTSKGINLYNATSNGKLTLVPGSPFKTTGLMIGSNGKHFISVGTDYVHSYLIGSNGAIKQQQSQINTQYYYGAECGTTGGAVLDHTGQAVYVRLAGALAGGTAVCTGFQTYKIASTSGALTFNGATIASRDKFSCCFSGGTLLTFTGDDTYAYSTEGGGGTPYWQIDAFSRESSGALEVTNFNEVDPTGPQYVPSNVAADPTNHLAASISPADEPYAPIQLASYTVDSSTGDIASSNTSENMPTPNVNVTSLNMSPSGKLLAVASNVASTVSSIITTGLQIFHFNGASPITPYSGVLTPAPIDAIHWDNSNHLYALSNSNGKLYVFTITPTSITAVSGSPFSIAGANGLLVVPK